MAATKCAMIEALEELLDEELTQFIWHLVNPTEDIKPVPRARLQKAVRHEVVDCIVQQFCADAAGNIAVKVLRNMKQNELANKLERRLQEVSGRKVPLPAEEPQLIQSDWKRPDRIIPCSQESKDRILRENRNKIYIPKDQSQRKRSALLVTNIKFEYEEYDRAGAEEDEKNMEWLLTALGYSVEKHTDLSGEEINAKVKNFADCYKHQDSDSTFVVLMSHGDRIDNKDAILGVHYHKDRNPKDFFFVDDIFSHLNSVNCRALIDKPKVILIQACRGEHTGGVEILSDAIVHIEKDFVSFKSCLPGIRAYRDRFNGSYFIMYILEVFCRWAHTDDIMELFRKVISCMEKDTRFEHLKINGGPAKLMPCIDRANLPNKHYLFPGL